MVRTHYRPPNDPSTVGGHDRRRGMIIVSLAAVLTLAGCGVEVSVPAADRDASRAEAPPAAAAAVPELVRAEVAGLQETLDELADAFRAADPDAVLGHLADPEGSLARRWAERARNLADVPLSHYELEHDETVPDLSTAAVRERHGAEALVVRVRERLRIADVDADGPAVHDHFLTIVPADDATGWLVANDRDAQPLGLTSARHLWDAGPIVATRRGPFVVLHPPERADIVGEVLEDAETALADVQRRWALEWSERVPIIVPRDEDDLARMLNVTFDLSSFVAFATATLDGELGSYELTGTRVVVNPDRFLSRQRATRQRILAHELLHVASRRVAGPFTPSWVEEAVAQRLGEGPQPAGPGPNLRAAIARGETLRLPVDPEFTTGGRERILLSYETAYSFAEHLVDRFGEESLARFYAALGEGSVGEPGRRAYHLDRAARTAFGEGIDGLREEWAAGLRGS